MKTAVIRFSSPIFPPGILKLRHTLGVDMTKYGLPFTSIACETGESDIATSSTTGIWPLPTTAVHATGQFGNNAVSLIKTQSALPITARALAGTVNRP